MAVIKIDKKLFKKIALEVEDEWQMGGFSETIYSDYAEEILKRYLRVNKDWMPRGKEV